MVAGSGVPKDSLLEPGQGYFTASFYCGRQRGVSESERRHNLVYNLNYNDTIL